MPPYKLPNELERIIFALVPRQTAYKCLTVARRVRVWLEPHLYRAVCLPTERRAKKFHWALAHRPDFANSTVETLCLNVSVCQNTAAEILTLCRGIKSLNIRFPCHFPGTNPILGPLEALSCVKYLCVDLSSIFCKATVYLPDITLFHRITHLHLTNAWATWDPTANEIGLELLEHLTHLSVHLSTVRTVPTLLKKVLARENLAVFILWKRFSTPNSAVQQFLTYANIDDKRIIVLDDTEFRHQMLDERVWVCAEKVVRSRVAEVDSPHSEIETNSLLKAEHPQIVTSFHSDVGWVVETDVETSDKSSENSDEESDDS